MSKKIIIGLTQLVEMINKEGKRKTLRAKVDTGADICSIDKDFAEWFGLGPVIKEKVIKSASGIKKRPVIKAKVKLHNKIINARFSLANRSELKYKALLGNNVLKKGFLVDPEKKE